MSISSPPSIYLQSLRTGLGVEAAPRNQIQRGFDIMSPTDSNLQMRKLRPAEEQCWPKASWQVSGEKGGLPASDE